MSITAQNLGPDFDNLLEDLLLNPIHARVWDPTPYALNPKLEQGKLSIGDRLIIPTVHSEHTTTCIFNDVNEKPEWKFFERHVGFWSVLSTETVCYMPFSSEDPVWVMCLMGKFSDHVIGDSGKASDMFEFLIRAAKPVFSLRKDGDNTFYPRGVQHFTWSRWVYESEWQGDHRFFSGQEDVFYHNMQVWTARFSGGIINSI